MNHRQLRHFLAVAELLNFRKAAEVLHMAQPPLSISIKRLEEDIGTPLFLRERRGLRLTPAGEAAVSHARQAVFHADQVRKSAMEATAGTGGVLKIGFVGSATYTLFPRILPVFRERYPRVVLDLRETSTREALRAVESGSLDVGLVRYPLVESTAAQLVPVDHDQLVAVFPRGSSLSEKRRLAVRDLANEPFIMYAAPAALNFHAQVLSVCQAAGFTPNIVQEAVQIQTVLSLVESGMGIALVPSACQVQASMGLAFKAFSESSKNLDIAIAVATNAQTESPAARRFREVAMELAIAPDRSGPAIPTS